MESLAQKSNRWRSGMISIHNLVKILLEAPELRNETRKALARLLDEDRKQLEAFRSEVLHGPAGQD